MEMKHKYPLEHAKVTIDGESVYLWGEEERERMQPTLDAINALGPDRTPQQVIDILHAPQG